MRQGRAGPPGPKSKAKHKDPLKNGTTLAKELKKCKNARQFTKALRTDLIMREMVTRGVGVLTAARTVTAKKEMDVQPEAVANIVYKEIPKPSFRERLLELLAENGNVTKSIGEKLQDMLGVVQPITPDQLVGRGLTLTEASKLNRDAAVILDSCMRHLRPMLGLDAPKQMHHVSERKAIQLTGTLDDFKGLVSKAREFTRELREPAGTIAIDTKVLNRKLVNEDEPVTDTHALATDIPTKVNSLA